LREKRRKLERMLDLPTQRRRRGPGEPTLGALREHERALLAEAEAEYKADLAARKHRRDAAAATGEATIEPSKGQDARRSPRPHRSALSHGVDRVRRGRIRLGGLTISSVDQPTVS
jgi:hypothetical protein